MIIGPVDFAKELLFPRRCPVCDDAVKGGLCCTRCREVLSKVRPPYCISCSKHVSSQQNALFCYDCAKVHKNFDRGYALFEYASAHDSIHMFKNRGRCEYADYYADCIWENYEEEIRKMEADALIPIPMHPDKMRKRGYNQATLLAKALEKKCKIPVREDILYRRRKTTVQKHLNHAERQNNMKKAFHIAQNDVKLSNIILIDDVYTTGSTINEAAGLLKECGVSNVYFIAIAIGYGREA